MVFLLLAKKWILKSLKKAGGTYFWLNVFLNRGIKGTMIGVVVFLFVVQPAQEIGPFGECASRDVLTGTYIEGALNFNA